MVQILFFAGRDTDPDGAEAALRKAGFDVVRMPARFLPLMVEAGDELMEARKVGDLDVIEEETSAIVKRFGGGCQEIGEVSDDGDVPFKSLHDRLAQSERDKAMKLYYDDVDTKMLRDVFIAAVAKCSDAPASEKGFEELVSYYSYWCEKPKWQNALNFVLVNVCGRDLPSLIEETKAMEDEA